MADPDFTIADVLAWARTKPADEAYEYSAGFWREGIAGCALCQFLRETGRAVAPRISPNGPGVDGEWYSHEDRTRKPYPGALEGPLQAGTFGGLVLRLEKLCPDTVIPPSEWTRLDSYMTDIETVSA